MAREKPSDTNTGERIQAVIKVIFDPETRSFGYNNPEIDCGAPFEYPSPTKRRVRHSHSPTTFGAMVRLVIRTSI